ncbi:TPA: transposase [Escherichia coli]|uniref:helix-turn-helix domain-containing protein n=1 Tax=Escherichia coli TaxID=562 RepID=UPI000B7DB5BB|nr:helix-turn-helix domain-containing protein [Escherichia coli]AXK31192.1 transposase [Escherichia coli]EGF7339521.1 transposase [Escherichia coli]EGF7384233.1 transposase [Escherichia coli]EJA1203293.1 transposase [Escherichia coli]EJA2249540.1 transposase [Escherichia coli]
MSKFPLEFKREVSEKYLEGELCLKSVGKMYNIDSSTVRKWAYVYRKHGLKTLTGQKRRYDDNFRLNVVRDVIDNSLSIREAAVKYGIPAFNTISKWIKKYSEVDFSMKGQKEDLRPKTPAVYQRNRSTQLTISEREELEFLRVENAYLKKLKALAQEKLRLEQKKK